MVYVTGDLHGRLEAVQRIKNLKILNKKDYLIVLGDFGFGFFQNEECEEQINKLSTMLNFKLLFIDGNHENFERLNKLKTLKRFGGKVGLLRTNIFHLRRGEIYNIDGLKLLTIGGANSIDKQHRIKNYSWWSEENINKSEVDNIVLNLERNKFQVDYVLSHTCRQSQKDMLREVNFIKQLDGCYTSRALTLLFQTYKIKFNHWYFGHFHTDLKLDEYHTVVYRDVIKLDKI